MAEPDASAIRAALVRYDAWWSSELLVVELRRLAARESLVAAADHLISGLQLLGVDSASLERASRLEPSEVRTLDAIHLEAAVALKGRNQIDAVLTYDHQLQAGCAHHALTVEAPSTVT